jgi:hypothetical protein
MAEETAEASLEAVAKCKLVEQLMCSRQRGKTCLQGSVSGGIAPPPPNPISASLDSGCSSQRAMEQSHA